MSDGPGLDLGIEGITNAQHIGSGGAADVYRAEQPRLGRTVAVKVLRANTSAENRARFEREAQTLGRLSNHPGIVTLHEAGLTAIGQPFLMMEFCPAGTLADRTAAQGPIAWQEACEIVAEISEVVDDAHESGVLHRDLKPANVLIDSRGKHLVADFGVAALSDTGNYSAAADFTPGYAPPETLRGDAATPAGDVYSLAATVHALVTGRVPFEAADTSNNNVLAWIRRIETEPPEDLRPIGIPDDVVTVIETAMSKEPTDRPSAALFSQQLAAAAEGVIIGGPAQPNTGDPMTTAVAAVLPQKPTSNQPPMPAAAPPMPGMPATAPPMPTGEAAPPTPAPAADSGHTTAVPQLLPQKPTSREVPGSLGAMPPIPGSANTGPVPPTPGQPGPSTAQVPPVPTDPGTGQIPPTLESPDHTTGPIPTPSNPVTGPAAFGAVATPAPAPTAAPAPAAPTPPPAAAAPSAPAMPASPIAPVGPTTGPDPLAPPPGSPTTGPVPAASELQLPVEPATAPVPFADPPSTDGQPATTAVPGVLPTGPATIDRPVVTDEDEGRSKKGLFIGVGVGAVALLGGGALLLSSLGGNEAAAPTTTEATTTTEASTTTASTTTTTEPTTTTAASAIVGNAEAEITPISIVLSGVVPDEATAEAIRAAAGNFYSRDQITDDLEVDSDVDEVKLTLVGELDDEDRIDELETAFEDVEDVDVVSSIDFVTTTAPPATSPPQTSPPRTSPPRTNPPTTPAPTTPPPPVETGNTNPGLG